MEKKNNWLNPSVAMAICGFIIAWWVGALWLYSGVAITSTEGLIVNLLPGVLRSVARQTLIMIPTTITIMACLWMLNAVTPGDWFDDLDEHPNAKAAIVVSVVLGLCYLGASV